MWLLGFPEAALKDAENAAKYGRETGQAASLMFVLCVTSIVRILCGNYSVATAQAQELFLVADEKGALLWKAIGMMSEGCVLASFIHPERRTDLQARFSAILAAFDRTLTEPAVVPR